jgi:hypothetical protein
VHVISVAGNFTIGVFIAFPLLLFVHRTFFVVRGSKFGALMAEEYPFPRWEIYYVLIVFPGLVTSSAQIFLMEGVHCRLAGLAGLAFTGAILLAMFLFMLVIVRPSSARRRVVFDQSRRGWLLAPPQRDKVTADDIEEDADNVLVGVVVRMTDWKVHDALDLMVHEMRSSGQKLSDLVNKLDANGDGWISKDELKTGLFQLNLRLDGYTVDMAMRAFDAECDGHIDRTEFEYCMREYEALLELRALQHALRKQNDLRSGQRIASLFSWSAWTLRLLEKPAHQIIEPAATVFEVGTSEPGRGCHLHSGIPSLLLQAIGFTIPNEAMGWSQMSQASLRSRFRSNTTTARFTTTRMVRP